MKSSKTDFKSISWQGLGLLLISAATLCFEINLTRLFSVSQFYHFAFMVVSIALLGFGASGTFLALQNKQSAHPEQKMFPWLAAGSAFCMLGAYLLVNKVPFDSFSMIVDPFQIVILMLHYAALASPFFFSGMIISLMLRIFTSSEGEVYALNLLGSAGGCLAAVLTPSVMGAEGVVAFSTILASLAGLFFIFGTHKPSLKEGKRELLAGSAFLSAILMTASLILGLRIHTGNTPAFFELHISPYKGISYALQHADARVVSSKWNSFSKVDVVKSPSLHSIPGLSYRYLDSLPAIDGLFVDGDNLNAILPPDSNMAFADYLPASVAFHLKPNAEVLILEPMGGMDLRAAVALGADRVTAVEGNPLIIDAAQSTYAFEGVDLVRSSGRSYLRGTERRYDVLQLPLTDSYYPVSSGAYALGEDYRYTLEALSDMLDCLKPNGLLVITRWLQEDPSEWLRMFTLAVTALEEGEFDPQTQLIALRGYNTGTLLIKKSPFINSERGSVRTFAEEKAFDLVYAPDIKETEINRFNILQEPEYYQTFRDFLSTNSRKTFYESYPYDVQPPTDDHPFFAHYFKWSQIDEVIRSLGTTWQPFGGAGYLVVLIIFVLALFLSSVLILLPVIIMKRTGTQLGNKRIPIYFGLIGLAFMMVEMPLIQRFILYLDQPAYAFAAVLFCILLFSGIGSNFGGRRLPLSKALIVLIGLLILYSLVLPFLLNITLGLSLIIRLGMTLLLIAPIGFLMGIPFPSGLAWMYRINSQASKSSHPWMVAWVWAVNGAASVMASILATLLALSFGFTFTFAVGTGCYLLAWLMARKQTPFSA